MRISKYLLPEDTPMTMQIAIRAKDGFVLASDIKNRITGNPVSSLMYHTKIALDRVHEILICVMGYTADPDADPGNKLAEYLRGQSVVNREIIIRWVEEYVAERMQQQEEDNLSLFILHPTASHDYMWKVRIHEGKVKELPSLKWIAINGNENSPAILWPEYFKCEGKHDLKQATKIAALTILTAGDLNPYGVRGLEIFQYTSNWQALSESELDRLTENYEKLKTDLLAFISAG